MDSGKTLFQNLKSIMDKLHSKPKVIFCELFGNLSVFYFPVQTSRVVVVDVESSSNNNNTNTTNTTSSSSISSSGSISGNGSTHLLLTLYWQNMNTSGFRVCVKELYETRYDPVSVSYVVLTG